MIRLVLALVLCAVLAPIAGAQAQDRLPCRGPDPASVESVWPEVYRDCEVDRQARATRTNRPLRALIRNVDCYHAVALFVVDSTGRVDTTSIRIAVASDPRLAEDFKRRLRSWRFSPALREGRRVAQIIQVVEGGMRVDTPGGSPAPGQGMTPPSSPPRPLPCPSSAP